MVCPVRGGLRDDDLPLWMCERERDEKGILSRVRDIHKGTVRPDRLKVNLVLP